MLNTKKPTTRQITHAVVVLFLVFGLTLVIVPKTVTANPGSVLAQGEWIYPDGVVAVEKTAKKYGIPKHLQLITNAMEFTFDEPTIICHGFYGAGKGWIPEFRYFWNHKWNVLKAETYVAKDPNSGNLVACVKAPFSAIYALFGYYPTDQTEAEITPVRVDIADPVDTEWSTGTPTAISLLLNPAPEWLSLFSGGVSVGRDEWVRLCHPFRQGAYGWNGEIRQLKDGKWVKTISESEEVYIPTKEGTLNVCTRAGEGTYALFGYLE